jgi:hypothetical protein
LQVLIGVTNTNVNTTFTLQLYRWYVSDQNYGLLINSSAVYVPKVLTPPFYLQSRSQIKIYPFFTRVDSDVMSPFRIAFKFPSTMATAMDAINNATNYFIFDAPNHLGSSLNY